MGSSHSINICQCQATARRQNSAEPRAVLHEAIQENDVTRAKETLRTHKIRVNNDFILWESPLTLSVKNGHKRMVSLIIGAGADCNKLDKNGRAAIHVATQWNLPDLIDLLISHGAQTDLYNRWGLTSLHLACEGGRTAIAEKLLMANANPNKPTAIGQTTPAIFASQYGHTHILQLLVDAGADVNMPDAWGNTPLLKATASCHRDTVRFLLDHGADPNIPNRWAAWSLWYAALQGSDEIVSMLLQAKCDPDKPGEYDMPPLLCAVINGHTSTAQMLVSKGADVNFSYDNGNIFKIPLYRACRQYQLRMVRVLLQAGAKVQRVWDHILLSTQLLVFDINYSTHAESIFRLLLQANGNLYPSGPFSELHLWGIFVAAMENQNLDLMQHMYTAGYNIIQRNYVHFATLYKIKFLTDQARPSSLKELCRQTVRGCLKINVIYGAEKLPLPQILKDYIIVTGPQHYSEAPFEFEGFNSVTSDV